MKTTTRRTVLEQRGINLWIQIKSAIARHPVRNSLLMFLSLFPFKYLLWHYTEESVPIFLLGVALISISAGIRCGLIMALPCFLAHYYFFTEPFLSFAVSNLGVLVNLAVYGLTLLLIALILGSQKEIEDDSMEVLQQQREWLGVVSHELRTPLNGIVGLSKIVREQNRNPQAAEHLNLLEHSALHLRDLLTNLLDFSQAWSHQGKKIESHFKPAETLKKSVDPLRPKAEEKKISLLYNTALSDTSVFADAGKIQQILINLVENAIKFTDRGQVQVEITTKTRGEVLWLEMKVEDSGIGIPPKDLPHIFDPFYRASGNAQFIEGTGIGLSMVRELTEFLGGKISVKSRPGLGSCFFVEIPVLSSSETNAADLPAEKPLVRQKISALVAEDNRVNQIVMKQNLENLGFDVDLVNNGAEAVSQCRQFFYDVVFLDGQMPIMDGFLTARAIRDLCLSKNWPCPPIFGFTADTTQKSQDRANEARMDHLFHKPIADKDLRDVLQRHLSGKKTIFRKPLTEIEQKIHSLFCSQLESRLQQFKESLKKQDLMEFSKRIHSFRSSCLAVDDFYAADLCRVLEDLADAGNPTELTPRFEDLLNHFDAKESPSPTATS